MMRVGEGERRVVPVEGGVKTGESLRIAVRPEQVHIALPGVREPNGGSRLTGTLAEIVYLGMYTQFHLDTPLGRVVSHRLADEELPELQVGSRVTASWGSDDAAVL
jgi:ABC-type Fe3+/spermidine/putrescine transport system ATPase subunit